MENSVLIECLTKAISETFEGIAFMEYDSVEIVKQIPVHQQPDFITTIEIEQPYRGFVDLLCKKKFIHETAETLLGDEILEDAEAVLFDTLGELINTVAGRFMANLIPENQDFSIGLPVTKTVDDTIQKDLNTKNSFLLLRFDFMDHPVFCRLSGEILKS